MARLHAQPSRVPAPRGVVTGRPRLSAERRPPDVEVLRDARRRRGSLSAARQHSGRRRHRRRASDLADQHRPGPARHARGARSRLHRDARAHYPERSHAHHHRRARAPRRAPAQLVRHADTGATAAVIRLDGGQRQPGRRAAHACGRPPRDRAVARRARRPAVRRDELPVPVRSEAPAVRDRLSAGRRGAGGPPRCVVLRSARLRVTARQLPGDRQGRRAGDALVPPRPIGHQRARRARAALVERDALRVPDAAAGDAQLSRHPARRPRAARRSAVRSTTAPHAACRGASRSRPTTWSIVTAPTSTRRSACPASG